MAFIRELVPRRAIALVARWAYNEPYVTLPMRHEIDLAAGAGASVAYTWGVPSGPCAARARFAGSPRLPEPGSLIEFITEHDGGYTRQRDGGTLEYEVQHPQWPVWTPVEWSLEGPIEGPIEAGFGQEFGRILRREPDSVLAAGGSGVRVHPGRTVPW